MVCNIEISPIMYSPGFSLLAVIMFQSPVVSLSNSDSTRTRQVKEQEEKIGHQVPNPAESIPPPVSPDGLDRPRETRGQDREGSSDGEGAVGVRGWSPRVWLRVFGRPADIEWAFRHEGRGGGS